MAVESVFTLSLLRKCLSAKRTAPERVETLSKTERESEVPMFSDEFASVSRYRLRGDAFEDLAQIRLLVGKKMC